MDSKCVLRLGLLGGPIPVTRTERSSFQGCFPGSSFADESFDRSSARERDEEGKGGMGSPRCRVKLAQCSYRCTHTRTRTHTHMRAHMCFYDILRNICPVCQTCTACTYVYALRNLWGIQISSRHKLSGTPQSPPSVMWTIKIGAPRGFRLFLSA